MSFEIADHTPIHFGIFEVDIKAREVRKHGVKVKLQQQPFEVLILLLQSPGQVVTRDALQKKLWPSDTFVDFDRGLNKAVSRIRETLGDLASTPRFIETLPRLGYRFIAPIGGRQAWQAAASGRLVRSSLLPPPNTLFFRTTLRSLRTVRGWRLLRPIRTAGRACGSATS